DRSEVSHDPLSQIAVAETNELEPRRATVVDIKTISTYAASTAADAGPILEEPAARSHDKSHAQVRSRYSAASIDTSVFPLPPSGPSAASSSSSPTSAS